MTHPGIPGIESQVTTQEAYDLIWDAKGWELIPYGTEPEVPPAHLTQALIGAPNGIASLDGTGKIPSAQFPADIAIGNATTLQTFTAANLRTRSTHTGTQSADTITDGTTNKAFLATERTKLTGIATSATANQTDAHLKDRANHTGLDTTTIPAATQEIAYAEITADITGIVVDALNIDLLSGLSVTIPNIAAVVYVQAMITTSSSVANAVMAAVLCKTSPTPTTILDTVGQMGFASCNATIGSKTTSIPFARIPANTPCTIQVYLSGAGTAAVHAQTYNRTHVRAWTV
jgi:hypothetical protein